MGRLHLVRPQADEAGDALHVHDGADTWNSHQRCIAFGIWYRIWRLHLVWSEADEAREAQADAAVWVQPPRCRLQKANHASKFSDIIEAQAAACRVAALDESDDRCTISLEVRRLSSVRTTPKCAGGAGHSSDSRGPGAAALPSSCS